MITIEIDEQTQEGRAILEVARLFSKSEEGVRILEPQRTAGPDLQEKEEQRLKEGLQYMLSESKAFDFLEEEEEIYTDADIIEKYHEQR